MDGVPDAPWVSRSLSPLGRPIQTTAKPPSFTLSHLSLLLPKPIKRLPISVSVAKYSNDFREAAPASGCRPLHTRCSPRKALGVARIYAKIAPASPHANHLSSHIFTRVGSCDESISSNLKSAELAAEAEKNSINGEARGQRLHAR